MESPEATLKYLIEYNLTADEYTAYLELLKSAEAIYTNTRISALGIAEAILIRLATATEILKRRIK